MKQSNKLELPSTHIDQLVNLITVRKPTTKKQAEWLAKLALILINDVNDTLDEIFSELPQEAREPAAGAVAGLGWKPAPVVDKRTKQQMTTEVLRRMQQQEDGHNKNPFRSLLDRLMRNEGGYSTIEIGQLKYALDGFYGAARAPAESVLEDVLDAARWRALLACGRIRIIGTAGVTGTGAHDPKALDPNKQPYGNYVHFGAEFWSTFPDQDYYNTKENPAYARATLTEFADAARAAQEGKSHE